MKFDITVQTPRGNYNFSGEAQLTKNAQSRFIEREFYEKNCPKGTIPQGDHHEIELLKPIIKRPATTRLHIHVHPRTKKEYVCWTGSLPTIKAAQSLFRMWCVGTAYALTHDADFAPLYKGDVEAFLTLMEETYLIKII